MTGAHNVKFGYQGAFHRDIDNLFTIINNSQRLMYTFLNGVPNDDHDGCRSLDAPSADRVCRVFRTGLLDG